MHKIRGNIRSVQNIGELCGRTETELVMIKDEINKMEKTKR